MIQPQIIPGFDVLKWKQEVQEQIYRETEGMSREEICAYIKRGSEAFREEQRCRKMELEAKNV
jgi:hypothetical protein